MTLVHDLLLIGAGFLGGLANSIAGGASLFTFPALVGAGLSPINANATNAFALLPANGSGAVIDRAKLPKRNSAFWLGIAATAAGGLLGSYLLLLTPDKYFAILVPALIGFATLAFIFGKKIQGLVGKLIDGDDHPKLRACLIFLSAIYAGYFGAGVGVVFMAVLSATTPWDLRTNNAYKNVLGFIGNLAADIIFIWTGLIVWPAALVMMIGTTAGGLVGVQLVRILPASLVRTIISVCGVAMTLIFVWRYWL